MRNLSSTIARLSAQRSRVSSIMGAGAGPNRLVRLEDFGTNPGALNAWCYVPEDIADDAALVVVLHGCTQNAAGFDHGTGWSQLADEHGFAVLLPEQTRANNFNLCFNWYEPGDSRRDAGEPLSVCQMIDAMVARHGIDRARIYVTGLSAGGAMTSVMLATYPDVFAGGAIVAGLPYGSASSVPEAFDRMRGHGGPPPAALAAAVCKAAPSRDDWPSVAVWHGTADATVDVSNARTIVEQWRHVHGAGPTPDVEETIDGYPHRAWRDAAGRVVIEDYIITGMGHGTPLATSGAGACGASGPYMLDVGISSTRHIAASWGLTDGVPARSATTRRAAPPRVEANTNAKPGATAVSSGVGQVIEDALRAAGLMR